MSLKLIQDRRVADVKYHRQDGFITAIVWYQSGLIGVGTAHCNKVDTFSEREGRKLAFKRAAPNPSFGRWESV